MSARYVLGVLAALAGAALGVLAIAYVATSAGLLGPSSAEPTAVSKVASTSGAPLIVATPTPPPGVVEVNGLADAQKRAASLRGKQVRVTVGETELGQQASDYLRNQGVDVSNVQVRLHPGQMVMTGTAKQGFISANFTVTGHPVVSGGALKLQVDSVDPSLLAQVAKIGPGQTLDVPVNGFRPQSVQVVEGQMIVTGQAQ